MQIQWDLSVLARGKPEESESFWTPGMDHFTALPGHSSLLEVVFSQRAFQGVPRSFLELRPRLPPLVYSPPRVPAARASPSPSLCPLDVAQLRRGAPSASQLRRCLWVVSLACGRARPVCFPVLRVIALSCLLSSVWEQVPPVSSRFCSCPQREVNYRPPRSSQIVLSKNIVIYGQFS